MFLSEIEGLYENSRGEKKKVKKKERKREGTRKMHLPDEDEEVTFGDHLGA